MKPQEIFKKIQELLSHGSIEEAKTLFEENKDKLGEYGDKAQALLKDFNPSDLSDVGGMFDKAKESLSENSQSVIDKIKSIFGK